MRRTSAILWAVAGLLLAGSPSAAGAGFMYFKDSPIVGESTRGGKGGFIEVESYQWGAGGPNLGLKQPGRTETGGPGTFNVVRRIDRSTPELKKAFDAKRPVGRVEIQIPDPSRPAAYYEFELTNVMISSYSAGSARGSTETIQFSYARIKWVYVEPQPPGSLKAAPATKK